jgi:hypothetical protein
MKGWHLAVAVIVAILVGYFAGAKYPTQGQALLAKVGL